VLSLLQQVVTDDFEGVLAGPPTNTFAVAGEMELLHLRLLCVGECDVDQADWLVGVGSGLSRAGAGEAGD